jgi:hypothetical protein
MKDLTKNRDSIGEKSWVEKKQWWAEHKDDLDESKMTKKEKHIADRMKVSDGVALIIVSCVLMQVNRVCCRQGD